MDGGNKFFASGISSAALFLSLSSAGSMVPGVCSSVWFDGHVFANCLMCLWNIHFVSLYQLLLKSLVMSPFLMSALLSDRTQSMHSQFRLFSFSSSSMISFFFSFHRDPGLRRSFSGACITECCLQSLQREAALCNGAFFHPLPL